MKVINKTEHNVTLFKDNGEKIVYKPVLPACRVQNTQSKTVNLFDLPITHTKFNEIINLPPKEEGVLYIVSALIQALASTRDDLVTPKHIERDENGFVVGCRAFGLLEFSQDAVALKRHRIDLIEEKTQMTFNKFLDKLKFVSRARFRSILFKSGPLSNTEIEILFKETGIKF